MAPHSFLFLTVPQTGQVHSHAGPLLLLWPLPKRLLILPSSSFPRHHKPSCSLPSSSPILVPSCERPFLTTPSQWATPPPQSIIPLHYTFLLDFLCGALHIWNDLVHYLLMCFEKHLVSSRLSMNMCWMNGRMRNRMNGKSYCFL